MGCVFSIDQFNDLISGQRACILLNSRQSKRPCRLDNWVTATSAAVTTLVAQDYLFITSLGMNTWELVLHLVNRSGAKQVIVIPPDPRLVGFDTLEAIVGSFRLDTARTSFYVLEHSGDRKTHEWSQQRDTFLISLPVTLVPVSIRPGGGLENHLKSTVNAVDSTYRVPYRKPVDRVRYDWNRVSLNRQFPLDWPFLTHWTRSADGPSSGQDRFEYYDSVLSSTDFPGSASHVLGRILEKGRLRASTRFIRGEYPVVSFTALHPHDALKLMRWRKRYAYYSFEPYGIAIDISAAREQSCREVIYGSPAHYDALNESDRPFFQNADSAVGDWRAEAEWRHCGDLVLQSIPERAIRVITYREEQAQRLRERLPYQVVSLIEG